MSFRMKRTSRPKRSGASLLPCIILAGCQAGYAPSEEAPGWKDDATAERESRVKRDTKALELSPAAMELESRLALTPAGKTLALAIRTHGGWDAWLAAAGFSYVRTRTLRAPEVGEWIPDPGMRRVSLPRGPRAEDSIVGLTGVVAADLTGAPVDLMGVAAVDAMVAPAAAPADSLEGTDGSIIVGDILEWILCGLPYVYVEEARRQESLGAETDARTGEVFFRVRYSRGDAVDAPWITVWFDRSTWAIHRVSVPLRGQKVLLVLFSKWKEVTGIQLPTERVMFLLDHAYSRWDPTKPDAQDQLTDL
jgi:hypothetical protein